MAVAVGFLAMSGFALISFAAAFAGIGEERVFLPGTYETTVLWDGLSAVLGLAAAFAGGLTCGAVGRRSGPIRVLALLAASLGVAYAMLFLAGVLEGASSTRVGGTSLSEAQLLQRNATWLLLALPILDVIGILTGGRIGKGLYRGEAQSKQSGTGPDAANSG